MYKPVWHFNDGEERAEDQDIYLGMARVEGRRVLGPRVGLRYLKHKKKKKKRSRLGF